MKQEREINYDQYNKAVMLLSKLFEFDSDIEKQINDYIRHYGIVHFFENLETCELDVETISKLQAVKIVLLNSDNLYGTGLKGGEVIHAK